MEFNAIVTNLIQQEGRHAVQAVLLDEEKKPSVTIIISFTDPEAVVKFKYKKEYTFTINESK